MAAYEALGCRGLRDEEDTVRPLPMCQQCTRWQTADTATDFLAPRIIVVHAEHGPAQRIECTRRVKAD